ncbi:hypothetical protein V2J09_018098 [Rumex salicifolius]
MAIEGIPPIIHAQLNYMISHSPSSIRVEQMWSGSKSNLWLDRFTLLIPYCLDYIKWDLIYSFQSPLTAPDIIFGPKDESFQAYILSCGAEDDKSLITNLASWNSKDPSRLLSLILQLRDLYSAYQRKRVGEIDDERIKFELCTMLSREPEEVKFSVPLLDMDINKMVPVCPWKHQQKIYLQVVYPVAKKFQLASSPPRLKLISTPDMKALFPVEDVKLPSWLDGMCMAEYLPSIEDTLQMQIIEAVALVGARRRFIEALATTFGRPLEADPIFCRKATFLVANGVFTFLVHFAIPVQFPKQQPSLILQSSQHFIAHNAPVKSPSMSDYPWSPRWEPSLMAERLYEFLVDESVNFKKYCNETVHLHQPGCAAARYVQSV